MTSARMRTGRLALDEAAAHDPYGDPLIRNAGIDLGGKLALKRVTHWAYPLSDAVRQRRGRLLAG